MNSTLFDSYENRTTPPASSSHTSWTFLLLFFDAAASIIGNLTILIVLGHHASLRCTTNLLMCVLCCSDLLVGLLVIPLFVASQLQLVPHKDWLCLLSMQLCVLQTVISMWMLSCIVSERYLAILHPLHYQELLTRRKAGAVVMVGFVLAVSVTVAPLAGWRNLEHDDHDECRFVLIEAGSYVLFMLSIFLFLFSFSLCLYGRIFYAAFLQRRRDARLQASSNGGRPVSSNSGRNLLLMFLLFNFFYISWLPEVVLLVIEYRGFRIEFVKHMRVPFVLHSVGVFLVMTNSAINPFLYGFGNAEIRAVLKRTASGWAQRCFGAKVAPMPVSQVGPHVTKAETHC